MWEDSLVGVPGKDFPHCYGEEVGGRSASKRAVACSRLRVCQVRWIEKTQTRKLNGRTLSFSRTFHFRVFPSVLEPETRNKVCGYALYSSGLRWNCKGVCFPSEKSVFLSVLLSGSLFFQTLFGLCAYFWAAPVELIVNSCSWAQLIEGRLALTRG